MIRFLKDHQDWMLMALAGALIFLVGWLYTWGIDTLVRHISVALDPGGGNAVTSELSLDAAKNILRERGFIQ